MPPHAPLYLGIDGGGTACRAALADVTGRILARADGGGANIVTDFAGALAVVLEVTQRLLDMAGVPAGAAGLHAALGLAGANVPAAAARFRAALPFARVRVDSDVLIAVAGAHGGGDGVVASLGTGSVFASQRGGVLRTGGGWGFVLGDEGSGAALGRAALAQVLRAADGLVPQTALLADLLVRFGSPGGVVEFAQSASPADFAQLAPRIVAAGQADDPVANAILRDADAYIARAVALLQGTQPVPLCFLGGLGPVFGARLAPQFGTVTRPPAGTPLDGALLLARRL